MDLPAAPVVVHPVTLAFTRRLTRDDEVQDLMALLLDPADASRAGAADLQRMAEWVAVASLGDNHLWQDLQLSHRGELSALMRQWFPALAAKNTHDMKWQKFLYKQLCEREQVLICKAPSCAVCSDQRQCFGPEV